MQYHLAFMSPRDLQLILEGRKTIESRFYLTRRYHPALDVKASDVLYFKRTGGDVEARATVLKVEVLRRLTPDRMEEIQSQYNDRIVATDAFWKSKQKARRGILIWLQPIDRVFIPKVQLPSSREGWVSSVVDFWNE